jgi:hypothetical protein
MGSRARRKSALGESAQRACSQSGCPHRHAPPRLFPGNSLPVSADDSRAQYSLQ